MAFWIAHGDQSLGVDDGLIRAADYRSLLEGQSLLEQAAQQRAEILTQARQQADQWLEEARTQSQALRAQAAELLAQARQQGLDQGLREASTQWATQMLDAAGAKRRTLHREGERLSQVVSMAVERIVEQEDRSRLFRRSLRTVWKLVHEAPLLTMRVHPSDQIHAQAAVDGMAPQSGQAPRLEVLADSAMQPGACRFESDQGIVETSLQVQLEALRAALHRTVAALAQSESLGPDLEARASEPFPQVDGAARLEPLVDADADAATP